MHNRGIPKPKPKKARKPRPLRVKGTYVAECKQVQTATRSYRQICLDQTYPLADECEALAKWLPAAIKWVREGVAK